MVREAKCAIYAWPLTTYQLSVRWHPSNCPGQLPAHKARCHSGPSLDGPVTLLMLWPGLSRAADTTGVTASHGSANLITRAVCVSNLATLQSNAAAEIYVSPFPKPPLSHNPSYPLLISLLSQAVFSIICSFIRVIIVWSFLLLVSLILTLFFFFFCWVIISIIIPHIC